MQTNSAPERDPSSPWLDTVGAAAYIGFTPGTLKTWRKLGAGPRYRQVNGRIVRYHRDDLDAFVMAGAHAQAG